MFFVLTYAIKNPIRKGCITLNRKRKGTATAAVILAGAFLAGGGAYIAVRDTLESPMPEVEEFRLEVPQVTPSGPNEEEFVESPLVEQLEIEEPQLVPVPTPEPEQVEETPQVTLEAVPPEVVQEPVEEVVEADITTPTIADTTVKELYISPVDGKIQKPWSNGELVYSETLGDYRVHTGADISAIVGSKVRAMADGEIVDIYTDDMLGRVIVIDHQNGVVTRYCNLLDGEVAGIEIGTEVEMGDVISGVGETALSEIAEGPHLHIEAERDGVSIDPVTLFE